MQKYNYRQKLKKYGALFMICIMLAQTVGGCGYEDELALREEYDNAVTNAAGNETDYELEKSVSYERPVIKPKVLIDQEGYQPEDTKKVLFIGEELGDSYSVIEKDSGEVVFTGNIQKKGYDEITDTYVSVGDFSEVKNTGIYYIETAVIGQSYSFAISKKPYEEQYRKLLAEISLDNLFGECESVTEAADVFANLLFTYEFYGKTIETSDNTQTENDIPLLLEKAAEGIEQLAECQDAADGSVRERPGQEEPSISAGYAFAAVMAQFSTAYKEYDQTLARQYLKAAEKAYTYCDRQREDSDMKYYAAAWLYKATGTVRYHQWMKENIVSQNTISRQRLYGNIVYLTTTGRVDQNICHDFMEELLEQAEMLAEEAESDYYLVSAGENRDTDTMTENMFVFTVADYVIVSHEYLSILKEHIHYLNGRNSGDGQEEYSLRTRTSLLFILGNMLHREENLS